MFQILILVCPIWLAQADCNQATAYSVTIGPRVESEIMCTLHGQSYIAPTGVAPREDEYVQVQCMRLGDEIGHP